MVRTLLASVLIGLLSACSSVQPPIPAVDYVDLERFSGDWFVIASIPTFIERDAYNAVEHYQLNAAGHMDTEFTFQQGGFDGKRKAYFPTGFVRQDGSNAIWGMQFIWPIKAEYRVIYLDESYEHTVIGRSRRDYAWIMARAPRIEAARYEQLLDVLSSNGYDTSALRKVPQQAPENR